MLEFFTHSFPLKRKEIWFYNGETVKPGTYTVFSAARKPITKGNVFYEEYQTSVIDLQKDKDALFKEIHPTYRYDIRSAEKQQVRHNCITDPRIEDCHALVKDYNEFAKEKDLDNLNLNWLLSVQKKGALRFSRVFVDEKWIATHIYISDGVTVLLSSSFHNPAISDNKLRSEANKLLHWQDILGFKEKGYRYYDFGGLNPGKLPGVSKFKTSFGGQLINSYRFINTSPLLFKLVKLLKK